MSLLDSFPFIYLILSLGLHILLLYSQLEEQYRWKVVMGTGFLLSIPVLPESVIQMQSLRYLMIVI